MHSVTDRRTDRRTDDIMMRAAVRSARNREQKSRCVLYHQLLARIHIKIEAVCVNSNKYKCTAACAPDRRFVCTRQVAALVCVK